MVEKEMKAAKAWFTAHFLIRKTKCDSRFSIVFQCLSWHSTRFFRTGKPLQGEPRALSPPCRGGKAAKLARWCREFRRFIEIQHMDVQKLETPQIH